MKPDNIKPDHVKSINSLDMKIPDITSNNPSSFYEQPSADLTKFPLLKSPENYSHASQFNKIFLHEPWRWHSPLTSKLWGSISSHFFQSLSINNIWMSYKYLKAAGYDISSFTLIPDTHPKSEIAKETINRSKEHFEFTLLSMVLFIHIKHQNNMSN